MMAELWNRGEIEVKPAVYERHRGSLWAGPVKLSDYELEDGESHYVPFLGYREDRTGVPFGPVRYLISPQDEVNARTQKLLWLLSAKRLIIESSALDETKNDIQQVLNEIARPDSAIFVKDGTLARGGIQITTDLGLAEQQFAILAEKKRAGQEVVSIYSQMLGDGSGTKSGVAINSLIDQGLTGMARGRPQGRDEAPSQPDGPAGQGHRR
jgi:hypothetical protein